MHFGLRIIQVIASDSADGGRQIRGGDAATGGEYLESSFGERYGHSTAHAPACSGDHGGWHLS